LGMFPVSRRWLIGSLKTAVTVSVLAVLLSRLDLAEVTALLGRVRTAPLLMAVALLAGSHLAVALAWRRLLEAAGVAVPVEPAVRLYFSGLFLNNFFLGSLGGDSYRVWSVHRVTAAGRRALAATILERLAGVVTLLLLGALAALVHAGELPPVYRSVLGGTCGAGAVIGLVLMLAPGIFERLAAPFIHFARGRLRERLLGVTGALRQAGRPDAVFGVLLLVLAAQGVRIWTHWWCARALGIEVGAGALFVAVPLIALAAGLPISVGGLGVREGSGVLLLAPLGIAQPEAVAMEFLAWLVGVVTSLIGGLAFLTGRDSMPPAGSGLDRITEEGGRKG
jgi:uncharacterized membrane protein YbhN (UPF0104 family)